MPEKESNSFEIAAAEAVKEFEETILPNLTDQEKSGIKILGGWGKKWYVKSGHKQLARFLVNVLLPRL